MADSVVSFCVLFVFCCALLPSVSRFTLWELLFLDSSKSVECRVLGRRCFPRILSAAEQLQLLRKSTT